MRDDVRDLIRHDDDCPGGEGCRCEDDSDCDEDEGLECDDEEEECVEREDGADTLRAHLARRYGAYLADVPPAAVARRAATILGVDVAGMPEAAMIALVTLRADAEWSEEDHPRDESGRFGAGGGSESSRQATEKADRATKEASSKNTALAHAKAYEAHQEAADVHRLNVSEHAASLHEKAADAHQMAAREIIKTEERPGYIKMGDPAASAERHARAASEHVARSPEARAAAAKAADQAAFRQRQVAEGYRHPESASAQGASAIARNASNQAVTAAEHHEAVKAHSAAAEKHRQAGNAEAGNLHQKAAEAHLNAAAVSRRIGAGEGLKNFGLNKKADEHGERARQLSAQASIAAQSAGRSHSPDTTQSHQARELSSRAHAIDEASRQGSNATSLATARAVADAHDQAARGLMSARAAYENGHPTAVEHFRAAQEHQKKADNLRAAMQTHGTGLNRQVDAEVTARRSPEGAHAAAQSGQAQHDHGRAHAERAQGHASRAKEAASGTTSAARASARKAAEHAALADVAARHGDHAGAKEHHDKAERHANDAQRKADEHRGAGGGLSSSERVADARSNRAEMRGEAVGKSRHPDLSEREVAGRRNQRILANRSKG